MGKHLLNSSGRVECVGQALETWLSMGPIRAADVVRDAIPVGDLRARVAVGLDLVQPSGERDAIEVFQLSGKLADDSRLTLGRVRRQRQMRPDVRLPITHSLPRFTRRP